MKRRYPYDYPISSDEEGISANEIPQDHDTTTLERPTKRFASQIVYEEDCSSSDSPLPSLVDLDLTGSCEITFYSLLELHHLENLVSLNLSYCNYLSDEHILALLGGTDAETLPMQQIDFSYTQITDEGMKLLALKCPHLISVNLQGCLNITDVTLSLLAQHCGLLERLILSDCPQISDVGVQLIAQETKQNLQVLNLNGCTRITDSTLTYLGYYCSNVSYLFLKNSAVTPNTLVKLLPRLRLVELNVQGIAITNQFLFLVARFQHATLRVLDISFCYNVTIDGIKRVAEEVDLLSDISMFGLTISKTDLASLRHRFPSVNYNI